MSYFVILFLVFLLQFVYAPIGISFFEVPKIYATEIGIFLLLLSSVISGDFWLWREKKSFLVVIIILFVLSFYHLLFHSQINTFWGNPFRMQGTLLLWFLLLFTWLISSVRVNSFPFFFLLFVFVLQLFFAFFVNSGGLGRAVGSIGEPNSLAGEIIFLWPFILFCRDYSKQKKGMRFVLYCFVFAIVCVAIFISGSRSGVVAFFLQLSFLVLLNVFRVSFRRAGVLCFIFLLLSYSLPFFEKTGLYENRGEVWKSALFASFQHPFLGFGFGNIEYALHDSNLRLGNHLQGYYVDSSHNLFLDWLVEGGIVGLLLLCFLTVKVFCFFVSQENQLYLLLLFGLLGVLSFNPVSIVLLVAFWWVIGRGVL